MVLQWILLNPRRVNLENATEYLSSYRTLSARDVVNTFIDTASALFRINGTREWRSWSNGRIDQGQRVLVRIRSDENPEDLSPPKALSIGLSRRAEAHFSSIYDAMTAFAQAEDSDPGRFLGNRYIRWAVVS